MNLNIINKMNEDLPQVGVRTILNGEILFCYLRKYSIFLIFVAFLFFIYIGNRIDCELQISKIERLKRERQDLRYEAVEVSSKLIRFTRRTNVINHLNAKGSQLRESSISPIVIE